MSMLAERRRKTKWVMNSTKKLLWESDSAGIKLGKELMEKMGWAPGKGLGSQEQGIQEPLKVSYKNDTKGMGFKGNDEDWIEHQDEFNSLLNQLTNSNDDLIVIPPTEEKNEIKSLEEKSKKSRARVHYQKFTRGKDLSKYSENDLACILGTNKSKKKKNAEENHQKEEKKKQTEDVCETSFGVTTINSGSIQDYFKKKWTLHKYKNDDPDEGANVNANTFPTEEPEVVDSVEEGNKKKKKAKKRKQELFEYSNEENQKKCQEPETFNEVNLYSENEKHQHKRKKKKHLSKDEVETKGEETAETNNKMETHELSNVIGCQLNCESKELNMEKKEEGKCHLDENYEEKRKKSKKKSKEIQEEKIENVKEPETEDLHVEKKKKKKEKKEKKAKEHSEKNYLVEEELNNREKSLNQEDTLESSKSSKTKCVGLVGNTCLIDNAEEILIKKKKKKKKHEKEEIDQLEIDNRQNSFAPEAMEEPKVKKKKLKKEKPKDEEKLKEEVNKCDTSKVEQKEVEPAPKTNGKVNKNSTLKESKFDQNIIHSHKALLFKKKNQQVIMPPKNYSNYRVLNLICGTEIERFKGSNLPSLLGYGMRKESEKEKEIR